MNTIWYGLLTGLAGGFVAGFVAGFMCAKSKAKPAPKAASRPASKPAPKMAEKPAPKSVKFESPKAAEEPSGVSSAPIKITARQNTQPRKPRTPPTDGSSEIYVGNLNYDTTDDDLRAAFEKYGKVNSARIITNRLSGKSKGYGFVNMPTEEDAKKAVAAMNNTEFMGRAIKCNVATYNSYDT